MKFVYKVSFAGGIVGFVNISADRGSTSDYLINKHTSALTSIYLVTDGYDM